MGQHTLLRVKSAPIHLKPMTPMILFPEGEMYLELSESDTELTWRTMILKESPHEETNLETEHLLLDVPM